jgi:uncharacterized membrane protein (DUF106 family)
MFEPLVIFNLTQPPIATLLIVGLALMVNVISSVVRKRFTDIESTKRIQKEVKEFNTELRKAIMSKDKATEAKLRKKQKKMNEMQMKMMSSNMKTSMYFMLPFMGIWWILISFFGYDQIMASAPLDLPLLDPSVPGWFTWSNELNFFWWYFFCSITFSGFVMKLLGTSMSD